MNKLKIRKIIQKAFFGIWFLLLLLLINDMLPSAHQFCPNASFCFGMLALLGATAYLTTIIIGSIIVLSSVFWGRKFCGYLCFWGTVQEWLYRIDHRDSKYKHRLSLKTDRYLKFLKYLALLLMLILIFLSRQYIYMKFCPVLAAAHPYHILPAGILILLLIIISSIFIERFWCRYLCPYAALLNLFQLLGKLLRINRKMISRNLAESINCKNCRNYCVMQIDLENNNIIADIECIHCYRCVRVCIPEKGKPTSCIYKDDQ